MPMKKYFVLLTIALALPFLPCAQVKHGLHFAYGFDEFQAPFLERTPMNQTPGTAIWQERKTFELSWDMQFTGGLLLRERFNLGFGETPWKTLSHQNHFVPEVWGLDGGNSLSLIQDFGYWKRLAHDKLTLSVGAGLGVNIVEGGGTWVGPLQSMGSGDPINEDYLIQFNTFGTVAQPFVGLSYSPIRQISIGLEQRHEFAAQSVHVWVRHDLYDGETYAGNVRERLVNDRGRSFSYMPPMIRIGWTFDPRKPKIRSLPKGITTDPNGL